MADYSEINFNDVPKKTRKNLSEDNFLLERTLEDVRELENYVREFSMFLPLPVCLLTPIFNIVDMNDALKKLTEYTDADIIGQGLDFLFHDPGQTEKLIKILKKRFEVKNFELELATKEGGRISVSASASARKDNDGNIVGYFLALSDISDLKKFQENLEIKVRERTKELEEVQNILIKTIAEVKKGKKVVEGERNKTASIIANFIDPVLVVDNNHRLILSNPAAKRVFKLTERAIGRKINIGNDGFSFDDFKDVIKVEFSVRTLEAGDNGGPAVEEVIIGPHDDSAKRISPFNIASSGYNDKQTIYKVMTAPVCDEKKVCYGHMKIFYDFTREKTIDIIKSEFISIAAHQLRTPLSAIKWAIKMVLDGDAGAVNEAQKNLLLKGYSSNERIINVINDMLDVSRIEEGRFGYEFKKCDFGEIIRDAVDRLLDQIKSKKINIEMNSAAGSAGEIFTVFVDREKIEIALNNLMENAVKYTPENGKIKIGVAAENDFLRVSVKDNGVGIPISEQKKLFSKFFRAENVVRMQTEGSGLGLYIAKNIIEKHGGTIECLSEEGRGAEFIFKLPFAATA